MRQAIKTAQRAILTAAIMVAAASQPAQAEASRSYAAKKAFAALVACPATGLHTVSCAGFVIDHKRPLCSGGADAPENMQWMTIEAAKEKDRAEKLVCAILRQWEAGL